MGMEGAYALARLSGSFSFDLVQSVHMAAVARRRRFWERAHRCSARLVCTFQFKGSLQKHIVARRSIRRSHSFRSTDADGMLPRWCRAARSSQWVWTTINLSALKLCATHDPCSNDERFNAALYSHV